MLIRWGKRVGKDRGENPASRPSQSQGGLGGEEVGDRQEERKQVAEMRESFGREGGTGSQNRLRLEKGGEMRVRVFFHRIRLHRGLEGWKKKKCAVIKRACNSLLSLSTACYSRKTESGGDWEGYRVSS